MTDVTSIIEGMQTRFDASAASGMDEVFQFQITDAEPYHVIVRDGQCEILAGEHDDPSVTLIMDKETFKNVLTGEEDGMQAFMAGKLKAEGDMMLATRLSGLFPV